MLIRGLILGLGLSVLGLSWAHAEILTFPGICDASAAIAIDEKTIIVGDDEKPWLSVYDLQTQQLKAKLPLNFDSDNASSPDADDGAEADIEGATVFKDRIVWISSHGRSKKGKVKPDRFQLFASHTIDRGVGTATAAFSSSFHELLPMILENQDSHYAPLLPAIGDLSSADKKLAPKKRGFNIEGLTTTRDGEALLIGLRNPQTDGKAVLFELNGFDTFLSGNSGGLALGALKTIDLGKRGIRDIAWSPAHHTYLIIAGQVDDDDAGPGFSLYKWDGTGATALIDAFDHIDPNFDHFHPEAVVPLLEKSGEGLVPSKTVLILSDDGTRPMSGNDCKDVPDAQKQFRGTIRRVD